MKKNILFFLALFSTSFLIAQNGGILQPPESVKNAFAKQYPSKAVTWSVEYGVNDDDFEFVGKFSTTAKNVGYALYDKNGEFKWHKEQISSTKLPKIAIEYLDKNYPISVAVPKSKSKTKVKQVPAPVREVYAVTDWQKKVTYEVKVKKEAKNYNAIFDEEGNYLKKVQLE